MHLLIPFASAASEPAKHVLRDLHLPHLGGLLQRWVPGPRLEGDEYTLSLPHERALARAWGWEGGDGALPFAARLARLDGVELGHGAWGLMTPVHWHVGREHISLTDPLALKLGDEESRAVFEAVRGLFESEGYQMVWAGAMRWYLQHDALRDLPCASLERALGRNVDVWMQAPATVSDAARAELRRIRRLQNEFQMLLYPHALTEARDARGEPAVNSFWLSGCGQYQAAQQGEEGGAVQVDERLRAPLLAEDWAAWAEAWRALDAEVVAPLLQRARHIKKGETVTLTLSGERSAQSWTGPDQPSWVQRLKSRWASAETAPLLESL